MHQPGPRENLPPLVGAAALLLMLVACGTPSEPGAAAAPSGDGQTPSLVAATPGARAEPTEEVDEYLHELRAPASIDAERSIRVSGDWLLVDAVFPSESEEPTTLSTFVLGRLVDGRWEFTNEADAVFCDVMNAAPDALVSPAIRAYFIGCP